MTKTMINSGMCENPNITCVSFYGAVASAYLHHDTPLGLTCLQA